MWKLLVEVKQEWKEICENFKNGVYWNEDFIKSTIYIFIWLMFLIFSIFTCLVRKIGPLRDRVLSGLTLFLEFHQFVLPETV